VLAAPAQQRSEAGALASHRSRNLFLEGGRSEEEIARTIDAAFQQLFHGDPETQTVYCAACENANGPLAPSRR
jgi:oligosaccharide reducing-end xylanase